LTGNRCPLCFPWEERRGRRDRGWRTGEWTDLGLCNLRKTLDPSAARPPYLPAEWERSPRPPAASQRAFGPFSTRPCSIGQAVCPRPRVFRGIAESVGIVLRTVCPDRGRRSDRSRPRLPRSQTPFGPFPTRVARSRRAFGPLRAPSAPPQGAFPSSLVFACAPAEGLGSGLILLPDRDSARSPCSHPSGRSRRGPLALFPPFWPIATVPGRLVPMLFCDRGEARSPCSDALLRSRRSPVALFRCSSAIATKPGRLVPMLVRDPSRGSGAGRLSASGCARSPPRVRAGALAATARRGFRLDCPRVPARHRSPP
jgi:hypothetical protein